jgi:hypothetical protein
MTTGKTAATTTVEAVASGMTTGKTGATATVDAVLLRSD